MNASHIQAALAAAQPLPTGIAPDHAAFGYGSVA